MTADMICTLLLLLKHEISSARSRRNAVLVVHQAKSASFEAAFGASYVDLAGKDLVLNRCKQRK